MTIQPNDALRLLAAYHALAVQVDAAARAQEHRAQELADLGRLALTNPEEAQRRLRALQATPVVWGFGNAVAQLRALREQSDRLLTGTGMVTAAAELAPAGR